MRMKTEKKIIINKKDFVACNYFEACDYFKNMKRLEEENKRLQMLSCANCGEKYLSPDGAELYEKNVQLKQALEDIRDILCNGRTFYEGYFDTPILSRTDKAIKVINEVLSVEND